MRKMFNIARVIIPVAALTAMLAGCSAPLMSATSPDANTVNVAVINASNSNSVAVDMEDVQPIIAEVCSSYGHFSYIIADGEPFAAYTNDIEKTKDNPSQQTIARRVNTKSKEIINIISDVKPVTDEVDLLSAIRLAAKDLSPYKNANMMVYTTGLATEGSVNMTKLTSAEQIDVAATVEMLKENNAIPDLSNINVTFYFTQTAGRQESLTNKAETVVRELWKGIIEAGGGTFNYSYYITDAPEVIDTSDISPVSIGTSQNSIKEYTIAGSISEDVLKSHDFVITLDEEEIEFIPNTAELKNADDAMKKIKPLAEKIEEYQIDILLVGSTATIGNQQSSIELSEERCRTIQKLLNESGISTEIRIKGYGYSSDNPFYTNDLDDDGNLVEEIAKNNRKVVVLALDSERAKEIMG